MKGNIVIGDAYLGGEYKGKAGQGSENKVPFVAVELSKEGHPLVARFDQVNSFSKVEIGQWTKYYLSESTQVVSDGLNCFPAVTEVGAIHLPAVVGKGHCSIEMPCFSGINILLGNLKTALTGTYYAFKFCKYAHSYLAEHQYRFNRRFDMKTILPHLLRAAATTEPRTETWLQTAEV